MTETTEPVSRSPTMAEVLRLAVEYHTRDLWTALPGKIDKFDASNQMADVKPLVQNLTATEDGEELVEPLPIIPNVPVKWPRSGGFYMTFPVKPGDFCLLIFCSRSIDKYIEGDGEDQNPGDFRTHDLTDAVAHMGFSPKSQAIGDYDEDAAVMGLEGGTRIRIADGLIEMGVKNAQDQLVVESKNQKQLKAQRDALAAVVKVFNKHKHITTATVATGPPGTLMPPASPAEAPPSIDSTASELVTIEK